jgi:glucose 1-dehydrogenase
MQGLTGKNVLITGASSGIGQAIAIRLAQEGCNIAINYRKNAAEAAETAEQAMQKACRQVEDCGVRSLIVQGDVSNEHEVVELINTVIDRFGGLDILINNAGIQTECPSHELSAAEFDRVLDTNLRGVFLCARETIKHLLSRQQVGSIINISSVHEIIPRPTYASTIDR